MTDLEIVNNLKRIVPLAKFVIDNERCISLDLTDEQYVLHGLARHSNDKSLILKLISKLTSLKYLNLRKNCFKNIDNLELPNLEYVDIASNYIGHVPDWLRGCELKYLNLGVNELVELPNWMDRFKSLSVLKLHKNEIRNFDCISELRQISSLNLYFNRAKKIPGFVWTFNELEFFSWGISSVDNIPSEICNLNKLKWLSMVGNKLTELPDEFCTLKSLIGVRLHKNRLIRLPDKIGELVNLEQITLYQNNLQSLPESFYSLKLKKLNLASNKFKCELNIQADWKYDETSDSVWYT